MNAAARLVHQSVLSKHLLRIYFLTKRQMLLAIFTFLVLLSALCIIYVTQITRILHATYQTNDAEKSRLTMQQRQLLLERSTWIMQARVQEIAENQLSMITPHGNKLMVINESE